MSGYEHYEHIVHATEVGERIDKFLGTLEFIPSRSLAVRLLEDGLVTVDGRDVEKRHIVQAGERIEIDVPVTEHTELVGEDIPLDIRFEDDHLIILSKQAGLVVHPAQGNWTGTLVHALLAHSPDLGTLAGEDRPGIVHRLDKDTTGLMMVAKTDEAQQALSEMIKIRSIDRRYITLVHGSIAPDSGLIDAPLARDARERMRMAVSDAPSAKQAVTTFRVLERFMAGTHDDGFCLVECKLYTGRTHQIRVHMGYIGHPCVGDQVYGKRSVKADHGLARQFLHAYRIELHHPITGELISLRDPLPGDLLRVVRELEPDSMGRTPAGDEVAPDIGL